MPMPRQRPKGQSLMAAQTTKRQRTCIGCGATLGKGALHRIVRNGDELFHDQELDAATLHQPKKFLGMWV